MKRGDWLIAWVFILIGIVVLTISATLVMGPSSIFKYVGNFFHVCMWTGAAPVIALIVYIILSVTKGGR